MAIFLTKPLIDSLKPEEPQEPEVPDYGGQSYPSFSQAAPQPAPQLGAPMLEDYDVAPNVYGWTPPTPQQPRFYEPGGAVGDVFSSLGSAVNRGLSTIGQQQYIANVQVPQAQPQGFKEYVLPPVVDAYQRTKQAGLGAFSGDYGNLPLGSSEYDPVTFAQAPRVGALSNIPPSPQPDPSQNALRLAKQGFMREQEFTPEGIVGVRDLPEGPAKRAAARAADIVIDPLNLVPVIGSIGKGARLALGLSAAGYGLLPEAVRAAGGDETAQAWAGGIGAFVAPFSPAALRGVRGVARFGDESLSRALGLKGAALREAEGEVSYATRMAAERAALVPQTYEDAFTPITRGIDEVKKFRGYVDLTKRPLNEAVLPLSPSTVVRLTAKQADQYGFENPGGGPAFYMVKENGEVASFLKAPQMAQPNITRTDVLNIARGRAALVDRFDMEFRLGRIPEQTAAWGRAFIEALPESYINNLSSSFVQALRTGRGSGVGVVTAGRYDPRRMIVQISKEVLERTADPTRAIIHEIAHHLEQFVSPADAIKLTAQWERELAGKGRRALAAYNNAQDSFVFLAQSAKPGAAGIEGQIAEVIANNTSGRTADEIVDELSRLSRNAVLETSVFADNVTAALRNASEKRKVAYRYTGFPEWFAENIADHFTSEILYRAPVGIWAKMVAIVKDFGQAAIEATRRIGGREDVIARVYNDIMDARYNPANVRDLSTGAAAEMRARGSLAQMVIPPGGAVPPGAGVPPIAGGAVPKPRGIRQAMDDADEMVAQDKPGLIGRILQEIPLIRNVRGVVRPGLLLDNFILSAYVARQQVRSNLEQLFSFNLGTPDTEFIRNIDTVFGEGVARGAKASVQFIGTPAQRTASILGDITEFPALYTFKDIAERPSLYNLSPEQKALIQLGETNNETKRLFANNEFDAGVKQFPVAPGGMHLPTQNISEVQKQIDLYNQAGTATQKIRTTSGKTRTYDTGFDHWQDDAARTNLNPNTSPDLYLKVDQVIVLETDIEKLVRSMDNDKISASSASTFKAALGGLEKKPDYKKDYVKVEQGINQWFPAAQADQIKTLLQIYDPSSGVYRVLMFTKSNNAVVLSSDFSPLIGVQGQITFLTHPLSSLKAVAGGLGNIAKRGDFLYAFRKSTLVEQALANPQWADYAGPLGISLRGSIADDLQGGLNLVSTGLAKAFGSKAGSRYLEFNEGIYSAVKLAQFRGMDDLVNASVGRGLSRREAIAAAADTMTKLYPTGASARMGLSQRSAFHQSLPFTSINFIRQPIALTLDAIGGIPGYSLSKIGIQNNLATERQRNAAQVMLRLWSNTLAISVTSQMADAYARGLDMEGILEAGRDAITPSADNPNFARLKIVGTPYSIPLGGPFRAAIKTAAPGDITVPGTSYKIPNVPFAGGGIAQYLGGRIQPTVKRALEIAKNEASFSGQVIYDEDSPEWRQVADTAAYAVAGALPLVVAQPYESGYRRGESFGNTFFDTLAAASGLTVSEDTNTAKLNKISQKLRAQWTGPEDENPYERNFYDIKEIHIQNEIKNSAEGQPISVDIRKQNLLAGGDRKDRQERYDAARNEIVVAVDKWKKATGLDVGTEGKNVRAVLSQVQTKQANQRELDKRKKDFTPNPILDSYYAAVKASDIVGQARSDQTVVDEWFATKGKTLVEGGKAGDTWADYIDRNTRQAFIDIPEIKQLREAQRAIAESGWWDLSDKAAADMTKYYSSELQPNMKNFMDYDVAPNVSKPGADQFFKEISVWIKNTYPDILSQKIVTKQIETEFNKYLAEYRDDFLNTQKGKDIKPYLRNWGYSESNMVFTP